MKVYIYHNIFNFLLRKETAPSLAVEKEIFFFYMWNVATIAGILRCIEDVMSIECDVRGRTTKNFAMITKQMV